MTTCSSNVRKKGSRIIFKIQPPHPEEFIESQNDSSNSSTNSSVHGIPIEFPTCTFYHQYCKDGIKAVLLTVYVDGRMACSEQIQSQIPFLSPKKSQTKLKNLVWSLKWDDPKYVAANVEMWKILLPPVCSPCLLISLPGRLWCPLELQVHWLFPVGISLELFDPQGNWNKNNEF